MAVRVDHQYVHCCCVHSTHCEWRTIGPRVHITMERIEADRILLDSYLCTIPWLNTMVKHDDCKVTDSDSLVILEYKLVGTVCMGSADFERKSGAPFQFLQNEHMRA